MTEAIPGYDYGTERAAFSPLDTEDLDKLKASVMFSADDEKALRQAGEVLDDQVSDVVGAWYDFIASQPHLVAAFSGPDGQVNEAYLQRVRPRFEQWVRDVCNRPFDQAWLNYQEEIGLRHVPAKKNVTDDVTAADTVPMRYLIALIYPVTATMRDFLGSKGHSEQEVEAMHQAWFKAVTLTIALWSRPYVPSNTW